MAESAGICAHVHGHPKPAFLTSTLVLIRSFPIGFSVNTKYLAHSTLHTVYGFVFHLLNLLEPRQLWACQPDYHIKAMLNVSVSLLINLLYSSYCLVDSFHILRRSNSREYKHLRGLANYCCPCLHRAFHAWLSNGLLPHLQIGRPRCRCPPLVQSAAAICEGPQGPEWSFSWLQSCKGCGHTPWDWYVWYKKYSLPGLLLVLFLII